MIFPLYFNDNPTFYNHCPLNLIGTTFRTKPGVHIYFTLYFFYIYLENWNKYFGYNQYSEKVWFKFCLSIHFRNCPKTFYRYVTKLISQMTKRNIKGCWMPERKCKLKQQCDTSTYLPESLKIAKKYQMQDNIWSSFIFILISSYSYFLMKPNEERVCLFVCLL